jgi:hypothetical protein
MMPKETVTTTTLINPFIVHDPPAITVTALSHSRRRPASHHPTASGKTGLFRQRSIL